MKEVSLTSAMRSNLLALQRVSGLMDRAQERLATGLRVNSALDNPSSYYTAVSLNNRAGDLGSLLDSMSQSVQTIKAAIEGIEAATTILGQMKAVAEQAATAPLSFHRPAEEFITQGYQAITSEMDTERIQSMITSGAKLVLAGDIVLSESLNINADDVVIEGNGYKISYAGEENLLDISGQNAVLKNISLDYRGEKGGSAVYVSGSAEITSVKVDASGDGVIGVSSRDGGKVTLDSTQNIAVSGISAHKFNTVDLVLYDGRGNTQAMLDEIGADALAATAANQFYVGSKTDANFGQGKWYLPAIGELMDMYGTDYEAMTDGYGKSGATGENKAKINAALGVLKGKGAEAETLKYDYYWSSSECRGYDSWEFYMPNGTRSYNNKVINHYVRCFSFLENCFPTKEGEAAPKIGDVMYSDLSYGSADDYDNRDKSKKAVGIVTWVSEDGSSARIINLKDLRFSSTDQVNNFNPDKPYEGSVEGTQHTTKGQHTQDVAGISNYDKTQMLNAMHSVGTIAVRDVSLSGKQGTVDASWSAQFNGLLEQYDKLVRDSSYKGMNLLRGNALTVIFNEHNTSYVNVQGADVVSAELGLNTVNWLKLDDIAVSVEALGKAVSSLRDLSNEMGNYYSIVQNRQDFTKTLINVLTEGADNLTLADMNEESANMLALQTRQQLGVSALQLSSEAARGVLDLF